MSYAALESRFREIGHLDHALAMLSWDEAVMMAPGGGAARADAMASLSEMRHRMLVGPDMPELLASAFTLVRQGLLESATLDIRRSEAAWACPQCGKAIEAGEVLRCPACDAPARLVSGDEILLEQIEMEVP